MTISFFLNGKESSIEVRPGARVSDVLRNDLGMLGTKIGCDAGDCGACTVLIDDEMACSCLIAIGQIEGCSITTVEGLAEKDEMSELQEKFLNGGAAQCGICTPGIRRTAAPLPARAPQSGGTAPATATPARHRRQRSSRATQRRWW